MTATYPPRACPWPGCLTPIRREHFMCRNHFGQLPLEHRIAVNVAWRKGDALETIEAQDAATIWAEEHVRSRGA